MDAFLPKRLDEFLRAHPRLMSICVLALAILACWALLASGSNRLVYEGF
jgi:hypothetical protein